MRVKILRTQDSCCGVLKQGWEHDVVELIEHDRGTILVLDDNSLAWLHDVQDITTRKTYGS
jgi:hypothetical protein